MMLRTPSGLVSVTPYQRTASGLVECSDMVLYGSSGPVDTGSGSTLTATAAPDTLTGGVDTAGPTVANTNDTTVSVSGGKPPYTYSWSSNPDLTVAYPALATTYFSASVGPEEVKTGGFTCTVTDAAGRTATASVTATVTNYRYVNGSIL